MGSKPQTYYKDIRRYSNTTSSTKDPICENFQTKKIITYDHTIFYGRNHYKPTDSRGATTLGRNQGNKRHM